MTPIPNTAGIVTQPSTLLLAAKPDILDLVRTVLDKCSSQVHLQLLDVRLLCVCVCVCTMNVIS